MMCSEGSAPTRSVTGWDIGGVNTKVALVRDGAVVAVRSRAFELQRASDALVPTLRALARETGNDADSLHVVTMTAELSQMFRTKREGVRFVLDAVESAFPESTVRVFTVDGTFITADEARVAPLSVAAANWAATAHFLAHHRRDALLVDIGTTTTDIIPIVGGAVMAAGRMDPERLQSGELVYTGALRTPVEAIVSHVPLGDGVAGVSAESFALAGDVHIWNGDLAASDYSVATPDGRGVTREFVGERLARVVCADREILDEAAISRIAAAIAAAQSQSIATAIARVRARHPSLTLAVVTGLGAFLADAAARAAGLVVHPLSMELGDAASRCAPATAVALLLDASLDQSATAAGPISTESSPNHGRRDVEIVVKLGGGVLAHADTFARVLEIIASASRTRRLLVVPGGGPFADAVRDVQRRTALDDDTAHWMAILGMDQYAHLVASRLDRAALVTSPDEIERAFAAETVPVLAPSQWLRRSDPLPHSWDATSDSIAAWIASVLHAPRLVVVKPAGASGNDLVDRCFPHALDERVATTIVTADKMDVLAAALRDQLNVTV